MAQRPQRRLRGGEQTLRAGRARGEPGPRRAGRHGPVPKLPPLGRRSSDPGQYGLVELVRRRLVSGSSGPVCDLRFGSVLRRGCDRLCASHGSQGINRCNENPPTVPLPWRERSLDLFWLLVYISPPFSAILASAAEQSDKNLYVQARLHDWI